jgi:hypothetical protein
VLRVEGVEGPVVAVGQDGEDDEGDEAELEDGVEVALLHLVGEGVQVRLEIEDDGGGECDRHRRSGLIEGGHRADSEGNQHCDGCGESGIRPPAGLQQVAGDGQDSDADESRGHDPVISRQIPEQGGDRTRQRDQRKGAHPGEAAARALTLQAHQSAEQNGESEILKEFESSQFHGRQAVGY